MIMTFGFGIVRALDQMDYLTDISRYQLISLENCGFYYNQCLCSFSIVDNRIDTAR
jgi:hypothetical protein